MPKINTQQYPFHPYQNQYMQQPFHHGSFPFNQQSNYPPGFFANVAPPSAKQPPYPQQSQQQSTQQPMDWNQQQPTANQLTQQQKGFISYFQDKDGQMDLDKMLNTASQVANTYQQFTPIVKGINSFFKGVK
jgi:hypothetical protein